MMQRNIKYFTLSTPPLNEKRRKELYTLSTPWGIPAAPVSASVSETEPYLGQPFIL